MYILTAQISDTLNYAQSFLAGFWPALLVVIAIPLGFYVIKKIIGLFPKK